jgi:hypothetical protein
MLYGYAIKVRRYGRFKPLGILENRIENNVLNKQKQLTLHQFFKNDNM